MQVGGKESVRALEGNALILTLNLLQFQALPHPSHLQPGPQDVAKTPGPRPVLWYCAWCFMFNSLLCAREPRGPRAQCRHQVQIFPPISQSGKEEGAQLDRSQKGKEPCARQRRIRGGTYCQGLLPQGRGQAGLALLCTLGALDWSVLNITQKMNWVAATIRRGTGYSG